MQPAPNPQPVLSRVLARFPEHALLIRRRFLMDVSFRSACEDYHLARQGLDAHQHGSAAYSDDYRQLVSELEQEMADMLGDARGTAGER